MRSSFTYALIGLSAIRAAAISAFDTQQQAILNAYAMAATPPSIQVPGSNNATFGPIAKEAQILGVEFLEVAPSTLPT